MIYTTVVNNATVSKTVNVANSVDSNIVDIAFADEFGNTAFAIKDGHIQTKNFNSRNIVIDTQKINSTYNKELSLFGLKSVN